MPEMLQNMPGSTSSPSELTDEFHAQLNRILTSTCFREAHSSRWLLEYIATHSLDGHEDHLKEFAIGVDVLGRRSDFDPKTDTIVRVQVHRLRKRISQYYETEGQQDSVFISIPQGHYSAEFTLMRPETEGDSGIPAHVLDDQPDALSVSSAEEISKADNVSIRSKDPDRFLPRTISGVLQFAWKKMPVLLLIIVASLGGIFAGYWIARRPQNFVSSDPVTRLWSAMMMGDPTPIIGYPDATFLLDDSGDMFRFTEGAVSARGELVDPRVAAKNVSNPGLVAHAGSLYYENGGYTGTGEIESIAMLTELLHNLGLHPRVKRSHDITADDLRTHNVILIGGSGQNKAVKEFLTREDFDYNYELRAWGGEMLNLHPLPGEASNFHVERDPSTHMIQADYALVSCQRGIDTSHRIIVLGGLDTTGTSGATAYITSRAGAETLSKAFRNDNRSPFFQAVIQVALTNGNEVLSTQAVAVRSGNQVSR